MMRTSFTRRFTTSIGLAFQRWNPVRSLAFEPTHTIVAGWDNTPHARGAVMWAARTARESGAELMVLRVLPKGHHRARLASGRDLLTRDEERADSKLAGQITRRYPGLRVRFDVIVGDPAKVLVRHTRSALVVLGAHGPARVTGRPLGPVIDRVLSDARGPVVVVPALAAEYRDELPVAAAGWGDDSADWLTTLAGSDHATTSTSLADTVSASRHSWLVVTGCHCAQVRAGAHEAGQHGDHEMICRSREIVRSAACPVAVVPERLPSLEPVLEPVCRVVTTLPAPREVRGGRKKRAATRELAKGRELVGA